MHVRPGTLQEHDEVLRLSDQLKSTRMENLALKGTLVNVVARRRSGSFGDPSPAPCSRDGSGLQAVPGTMVSAFAANALPFSFDD